MQRAGEGSQGLDVTDTSQLHVKGTESMPLSLAGDPDEGREIERGIIADIFIISLHCRIYKEVSDSLINRTGSLERGDERSNVLEGGTSHDLRRWV